MQSFETPQTQCLKSCWFHTLSLAVARLQLIYYPERALCWAGEDGEYPGRVDSIAASQCALPIERAMEKHFWPFYRWEGRGLG